MARLTSWNLERVLADGLGGVFARRYLAATARQLAHVAAGAVLAELLDEGVDAATAAPLCELVRAEVLSKLGAHPPARQQPKLTLVPRKPKPTP